MHWWVDVLLGILLIGFAISGYLRGFWISTGRMIGFIVGTLLGLFLMPLAIQLVPSPGVRVALMILLTTGFVVVLIWAGTKLGTWMSQLMKTQLLTYVNKISGAIVNVVIAASLFSLISFSLASMGVPGLTAALKDSRIIAGVTAMTPESARTALANLRSDWLDREENGAGPGGSDPWDVDPTGADATRMPSIPMEVQDQYGSTVRISGKAYECGQNQTGSGFAVSSERVMTNAHVVAGLEKPQVETANGRVLDGEVVYFDEEKDVALLALPGAGLDPLETGLDLVVDGPAFALGYPSGGPFKVTSGWVQARGPASVNNIYGEDPVLQDIYQLRSDIRQGNSGGPVVDKEGRLVGMIFARAPESQVGYALTLKELQDVLDSADDYTQTVSTGKCLND